MQASAYVRQIFVIKNFFPILRKNPPASNCIWRIQINEVVAFDGGERIAKVACDQNGSP